MHIENKRVINIASRLIEFPENADIRVITVVTDAVRPKLTRLGFTDSPADGETVLPPPLGSVSRFNADGKWIVQRDQPKESRYICTVFWRWKTWAGRDQLDEHEDFRDVFRDCYPRELVAPPALELTYAEQGGRTLIVSHVFRNRAEEHESIRHAVNLFLELFGACDILPADLERQEAIPLKYVNWRLLPPGQYPWDRLGAHLDDVLQRRSPRMAAPIRDRQETIKSFQPDEIHIGAGGFRDYLAYVFKARGLVVLESVQRDNALYVFGLDWERVSQLSKAEVIAGNHHVARIIHAKGWKEQLARLFNQSDAAE